MPRGVRMPPEDIAGIVGGYQTGAGIRELAKRFHYSFSGVRRQLDIAGVLRIPRRVSMTPATTAQIVADYRAGVAVRKIEAAVKLSRYIIYQQLDEADVPRRRQVTRTPPDQQADVSSAGTSRQGE